MPPTGKDVRRGGLLPRMPRATGEMLGTASALPGYEQQGLGIICAHGDQPFHPKVLGTSRGLVF